MIESLSFSRGAGFFHERVRVECVQENSDLPLAFMSKPSIAELLTASGHTEFTLPLVMRAMYSLYGNIGANLDERNWLAILQGSDPLQASEDALMAMYQDSGYLLLNTQHLVQNGYVAAQAEITYRQMAGRLGYTYNPAWSDGTAYDYLGDLTYEQLVNLVPAPPPPPPLPTISVSASATGFSVALNVAGTVNLSVSGDLGNFAAGSTLLGEQGSVKEGFLTLSANGNTSAATSQYVVLGTSGDDIVNFSALASRVDYIFGGAGNDHITGGAGVDTLTGGDGDDRFYFALSADLFANGQAVDSIDGGAGTNTLVLADSTLGVQNSFDITATSSWARISNVSRIEAEGPYGAQFNLVLSDDAYEAGLRVIDLSADTQTNFNANFINVSAETGAANGYTLVGHGGADFITGGAGNDTISGGSGNDVISGGTGIDRLSGGSGQDRFVQNQGDSAYLDDPASTIANRTASGSLANGDVLKFPNGQIDIVTDFNSVEDAIDASAVGANYTDSLMWRNYIRGQGHYAKGNWDGTELFTIDYATGRDILYFVSLNGANLAFNAFDIANGGIVLIGAGTTGFTAANII